MRRSSDFLIFEIVVIVGTQGREEMAGKPQPVRLAWTVALNSTGPAMLSSGAAEG